MRLFIERRIVRFEKGGAELSETKFNVGDIVKIKYHTESEKNDYPFYWAPTINQCEGQTFVIEHIQYQDKGPRSDKKIDVYRLENSEFAWDRHSLIKIENAHYQTF